MLEKLSTEKERPPGAGTVRKDLFRSARAGTKCLVEPKLVWLSGLSVGLQTKGSPV